jgi:hypothetical protein
MKKIITTLSLGENYTKDYTNRLIKDVLDMSNMDIYITTDCKHIIEREFGLMDRIKITEISREKLKIRIPIGENKGADDFNFNMRYLCLEPVLHLDNTLIIFTDCDNSFDFWDEKMIDDFIDEYYTKGGFDFFAPRNDYKWYQFVDDYKKHNNREHGIFWHKIFNYDLDIDSSHDWDLASLPAEYLLLFVNNNDKLRKFYEQWKWFHDYLCNKEYSHGTWAEGFEIGVSGLVAGFKDFDISFTHPLWSKIFTANGYKTGSRSLGIVHSTER